MSSDRTPVRVAVDRVSYRLPDGRTLFDDVTLAFASERTALVGANGSGKSTLARIVAGQLAPTSGSVVRRGAIGWLPQELEFARGATVADALGVRAQVEALDRLLAGDGIASDADTVGDGWDVRERAERVLREVGLVALPLDRSLGAVSGGEATRIALAGLLLRAPALLVLDEPTNHLDANARASLYDLVRRWEGGLLLASHDRELLLHVDRIVELSALGVRQYGGNYAHYRAQREAEEEAARRELDAARQDVARATRVAREARERKERRDARGKRSRAEGGMPKILMNMRRETAQVSVGRVAADSERAVAARRGRLAEAKARVALRERLAVTLPPSGVHARKRIVELREVGFSYGDGGATVLDGFELAVVGSDRVALVGANGSGKSTALRLIAGLESPTVGAVTLGVPRERVALLEQRVEWTRPNASLLDNFLARNPEATPAQARESLAAFLFRGDAALRPVSALSGGEALRGALAALLHAACPPQLLLLDEPTNHLDLESLEAVERALASWDGAMVVVSHDRAFLAAVGASRIVSLGE